MKFREWKPIKWFIGLPMKTRIISAIIAGTIVVGSSVGVGIGIALNDDEIPTDSSTSIDESVGENLDESGDSSIVDSSASNSEEDPFSGNSSEENESIDSIADSSSEDADATPHQHDFSRMVIENAYLKAEATCESKAEYFYACACGAQGVMAFEYGSALGHSTIQYNAQAATCTEGGWEAYEACTRTGCAYTTYVEIPAHHTWDEGTVTRPASCEQTGEMTYVCGCGETYIETLLALEHSYVDYEAQEPTCTEIGWGAYRICDRNGCDYTTYQEIAAEGHTWGGGECTRCGAKFVSAGLEYTINSDQQSYSVTGMGACSDYRVVIASTFNDLPVTGIGPLAFANRDALLEIEIPDSVTSIGDSAFSGSQNLEEVEIPNSVTSLGNRVFYNCTDLRRVVLPNSITSIGEYVFSLCSRLTYNKKDDMCYLGSSDNPYLYLLQTYTKNIQVANIAENCRFIAESVFSRCVMLQSVSIPEGVISIGSYAFSNCVSLMRIEIPDTVTSIKDRTFELCESLATVEIGERVSSIGVEAFSNCIRLQSIKIPDAVTVVETKAFYNCKNLTELVIGAGVTKIKNDAFRDCRGLTSIQYNAIECEDLKERNQVFYFAGEGTVGIKVTIGANVKKIPAYLFAPYTANSNVNPKLVTVEFEEGSVCESIGENAFSGSSYLAGVYITDIETWCRISFRSDYSNPLYYAENLYVNNELVTELVVPNTVTEIKGYAFYNCRSLTSVVIPDGVTTIGYNAFYGCTALTGAYYQGDVGSWCRISFRTDYSNPLYYAKKLYVNNELVTELVVPNTVTEIKDYAFYKCDSLTSVDIPDSVTTIGDDAFCGCSSLTSVVIGDSVTTIGKRAFSGCRELTEIKYNATECADLSSSNVFSSAGEHGSGIAVTIGENVKQIPAYLFSRASYILRVEFMAGSACERIGAYAFNDCSALTTIEIPSSITSFGTYAFNNCSSLTSIEIPSSITSLERYTFNNCTALTEIKYNAVACEDLVFDNYVFALAGRDNAGIVVTIGENVKKIPASLFYPYDGTTDYAPKVTTVDFEENGACESIGDWSFAECAFLTGVVIPNTVTTIGDNAFVTCIKLKNVTIPNSITSIGGSAFRSCSSLIYNVKDDVQYLGNETNPYLYAGTQKKSITDVVIDEKCRFIASFAFEQCVRLTSVSIPDGVITIGDYAFSRCAGLTSVSIPDGVITIGDSAFSSCAGLTSVEISRTVVKLGEKVFYGCRSLTNIIVDANNSAYSSLEGNLYNKEQTDLIQYAIGKTAREFIMPNSVTSIHAYAFAYAVNLTSVNISNLVTSIGNFAFTDCTGLTSIKIPNYVTHIGTAAFSHCTMLQQVVMGLSVESLGGSAFSECTSLTQVRLSESLKIIGDDAFYECTSLVSITIPYSVQEIGSFAFASCDSLAYITFESPSCWYYSSGMGQIETSIYLDSPSKNAQYFTSTYASKEWIKKY